MKKLFSFLFAIITLMGTSGVFTSCQEDAPEINYTVNITVNNDFTEVVNAINNGTLKQTEAVGKLTASIDQMNGDQAAKLQALMGAINTLATTLDAKLALIEATLKAQTLALETKLDLLTAAIDTMSDDLTTKLNSIRNTLSNASLSLGEKLLALQASMDAQTLTLKDKLGLIETAIKNIPNYTDRLKAIEAAIKGMPDYSDKLAAIETAIKNIPDYSEKLAAIEAAIKNAPDHTAALEEIKKAIAALPDYTEKLGAIITAIENLPDYTKQLEAIAAAVETIPDYSDKFDAIQTALAAIAKNIKDQQGQYADELAALTDAIDDITKAVEAGNLSQEDALAEIIALLESGALAGGGSGSNDKPYITLIATEGEAPVSFFIPQSEENELELEGATIVGEIYHGTGINILENSLKDYTDFEYSKVDIKVTSADKKVKVYGKFTTFIPSNGYTSVDTKNNKDLKELVLSLSTFLESLTVADDGALTYIDVTHTELTGANATAFMESLPTRAEADNAILYVENSSTSDNPEFTDADKSIATEKNWKVSKSYEDIEYNNWISIGCGDHSKIMYAYVLQSEYGTAEKGFQAPIEIVTSIEGVSDRYNGVNYKEYPLQQFYDDTPMLLMGDFTLFVSVNTPMTHLDASTHKVLKELTLKGNSNLSDFKIASDGALEYLDIRGTKITGDVLNDVISSLPNRTGKTQGTLYADGLTDDQKTTATSKNWKINP